MKEKIYLAVWKVSFLCGSVLLVLSILGNWMTDLVYGISGVLIFLIPYICMVNTSKQKNDENYFESDIALELSKIEKMLKQFDEKK